MHVPLRFLRHVIFRSIYDLLHHPEVVSGGRADLRSKGGSFLVDSIARCASSTEELASQRVEVGKTASLKERVTSCLKSQLRATSTHQVIQAAAHGTVSATFFVQELNKVRLPATTFIFDGLATLGEELYRGE